MKQFLHLMTAITLLLTATLVGILLYWTFEPSEIIKIENQNAIQVDKEVYHPGDRITYTFSYCKTKRLVGVIDRALIDGVRITFATIKSDLDVGCSVVKTSDIIIPEYVDSETYYLEGSTLYKINPIKDFQINWRTVEFKVEK